MDKNFVVVGAEHPVIGSIYLNVIPDSLVGFSDIHEITTRLTFADVWNSSWRQQSLLPKPESRLYDESVLKTHMQQIDWHDNRAISQMCKEHNIQIDELHQWCLDLSRWKDIPVCVEKDPSGCGDLVPMFRIL